MTEEKPLHVRVAEALGWEWGTFCGISILMSPGRYEREAFPGSSWTRGCTGEVRDPETTFYDSDRSIPKFPPVPRYDTDWSATGPLIEKYEISLDYEQLSGVKASAWRHVPSDLPEDQQYGGRWLEFSKSSEKSLIAVCNLILALKEAGKL